MGATISCVGKPIRRATRCICRTGTAPSPSPQASAFNGNRLLVKTDPTPPDQLISVTSSTGLTTRLTYAPLTNAGGRYTGDRDGANTRIYPKVHLTPSSYVVTTSTTDSGVGTGT